MHTKKIVFIFGSIVAVLVLIGGSIIVIGSGRKTKENSGAQQKVVTSVAPKAVLTWDDPAGFTFSYPQDLSVNKHDEDQVNYAHIELTQSAHPGNIIVWAKDTTAGDATAWVRTEKEYKNANIFDTTLGGQPAKKIILTSPRKAIVVGTVYDELLWTIEQEASDSAYWAPVFQSIVDSYQFKPLETSEDFGGSGEQATE